MNNFAVPAEKYNEKKKVAFGAGAKSPTDRRRGPRGSSMQLFVAVLGRTVAVDLEGSRTVGALKQRVEDAEGIFCFALWARLCS